MLAVKPLRIPVDGMELLVADDTPVIVKAMQVRLLLSISGFYGKARMPRSVSLKRYTHKNVSEDL
jgi:hypothetical protein